mmetsp:Transcript_24819/g.35378  ORF Transcript_24819/g.35378 Transcript_24819/m.35378 type:complete len:209 (-) Transcript_24819:263-889(-)|eukprot:CAMPEP_0202442738 /NCGR_PEP_ID=MMETSP1360-20130828/2115_1 /ASSEMBLY_ACC=CAM_ASM_000848 /TAXON_ID=515479 /ORGANISM="Licmophora paradoxa, Strain CCMP2313" /LENGTH=208 /DNA_ID=CAMNT_0049058181 /DNA_START=82 /DNA_END=708 /DNA_ORIENTATION=+
MAGQAMTPGMDTCPAYAAFFGYMGAAACCILANFGSAWGTWRAGLGVCQMGVNHPRGVMKNIVPIVMAGVLGIYGLIVSVIIVQSIMKPNQDKTNQYSVYNGYAHLAAGLCCGLSCLAAGGTIGVIGETATKTFGMKASGGKRFWDGMVADGADADVQDAAASDARNSDDANKLYVGSLIMLIFAEALALYGLIVALILSQHQYNCGQ